MQYDSSTMRSPGVFGPEDMNILRAAYNATCARLAIPVEDTQSRQRIIKGLLERVNSGDRELALLSLAIGR